MKYPTLFFFFKNRKDVTKFVVCCISFCLISDVIFFIFLYQRYIYRVDPTRVNEFGTSQEMFEQNGDAVKAVEGTENQSVEQNGKAVQKTEETENRSEKEDNSETETQSGEDNKETESQSEGEDNNKETESQSEGEDNKDTEELAPPKSAIEKKQD